MKRQLPACVLPLVMLLCLLAGCAQKRTPEVPVLPEDPFGQTFYYQNGILFDSHISQNNYTGFIPLTFQVTESGRFLVNGKRIGYLEELVLTEENFDSHFFQEHAALTEALRTENAAAWTAQNHTYRYLLLRQTDGQFYLARGGTGNHYSQVFRLGGTPVEGNGKKLWYGEEAAAIETSLDLADGSAYISTECVYQRTYNANMRADSTYYYYIDGDDFVPVHRWLKEEQGRTIIPGRAWQPLPWTEEEWQEKPYYDELAENTAYADWRYLPLENSDYFLSLDGGLWLVNKNGQWAVDSVYRLEQMDSLTAARWAYMEGVERDHLPLELVFQGNHEDYDVLLLDSANGQFYGVMTDLYTSQQYRYDSSDSKILYWSPVNSDGSVANKAEIQFALLKRDDPGGTLDEDSIFLRGTITAKRSGTTYKKAKITLDGKLPDGFTISVLDAEGNTLRTEAG